MKRVERLFQLMRLMRDGRVLTSEYLSKKLGVSIRTIYRDIGDLVESGVPIDGQSGVGFLLRDERELPTVIFTEDELQALALGAEMVRVWSDRGLGDACEAAMHKLERVLPRNLKARIHLNDIEVHGVQMSEDDSDKLKIIRVSLKAGEKLALSYPTAEDVVTQRIIRPLWLSCRSGVWSVGAWCELRGELCTFQADRIVGVQRTTELIDQTAGSGRHDYLTCQLNLGLVQKQNGGRALSQLTPADELKSPVSTMTTLN